MIRGPRDQCSFDSFPGLIAVFHALHRLLAPRHPPHALGSLAALILSSARVATIRKKECIPLPAHPRVGTRNDPYSLLLGLSKRLARNQTTTATRPESPAGLPSDSCDLQLLPLPNCQRTLSSECTTPRKDSGTPTDQDSLNACCVRRW